VVKILIRNFHHRGHRGHREMLDLKLIVSDKEEYYEPA
jgi:hypothetical protein